MTAQLSIEELNEIVQGQLTLGTMPPVGGLWAPVGRIVCDSRQVRRGDVFWGLPGSQHDGSDFAEEALIRAAQGTVVAGRHLEPWAGSFSIRAADSARALLQLGQWTRRRFHGTVVGMHMAPS
ncbi:MAG: Mur ligase domain-containing protein, partial [Pirellulaceae bacterium]